MLKKIVLQTLLLAAVALSYPSSELTAREIISLDGEWQFATDPDSVGESQKWESTGLPEAVRSTVTVPHTWNVQKGLEKYAGTAWYQRDFDLPEGDLGKTVRIRFDAVYHDAFVYVNGKKAGEHIGSGYNRFHIDISPFLVAGKNTVTVRVSNAFTKNNIPFEKSFDWANDGGIYRSVALVKTDPQAIKHIHVLGTPKGEGGTADIRVSFIDTAKIDTAKTRLIATITEENQKTSERIFESELAGGFEDGRFLASLDFEDINPWHFDSPNLYELTVQLMVDGIQKDELTTTFGFRSIKIENNRYVLNGEPIRLMGVEWMPGSNLERGMAETHADLEKNLKLMKNANCIYTRFHWQQDEYILDWCDRNGILVQEEIPLWGGATMMDENLYQIARLHLQEMTDNHFNHPSVITWGLGNELVSNDPTNIDYLMKLYHQAKELDPSRLATFVTNKINRSKPSDEGYIPDVSASMDLIMFNEYYSTWFYQSLDVVSDELDRLHHQYDGAPITIAEWGLCEPVHKGGDPRRCEEMVTQLEIYGSKDFVAGAIYFCLNDYRTHMGEDFTYDYPQRVHGVCDIHLNPKPSYEVLKAGSSPIEIKAVDYQDGEATITLYGKTGIPSYTVRGYTLTSGEETIHIEQLKPGEAQTLRLKTDANEFVIQRPTGFEVVRQIFK
ncbi:glycoside hydrolase family 2 TIM barrel-domain containing protein [Pelagicoccus enzymogenes]|uniref:glycoside hydrolase family 2 protein n=1 Tax=Pelagicoccus enzymogenes TaxID=2773457 RepID=UPI00280EE219|nr:sugar-binding domain-containing protein [Pelagicoccus enzymogenes]MDQ8199747.1 glycoside hydrolase family 2 TIM barrel-domain containing protein [Pelagicoccus enzymogenes]